MSEQVEELTETQRGQIEAEESSLRIATTIEAALAGELWEDENGEFMIVNDTEDAEEFAKLSGFESLAAWGKHNGYGESADGTWLDEDGDEIDLESTALEFMESEWHQCDFLDYVSSCIEVQVLYNSAGEAVQASLLIGYGGPHIDTEGDRLCWSHGWNKSYRNISGLHDALLCNEPDLELVQAANYRPRLNTGACSHGY
jgi:hypothetical protein